ncbi:MAG: rhodanese-like domain-containing protein [Acidobacteriota bacterium]
MDWKNWLIAAVIIVAFFVLRRIGQISAKAAREHLKNGAVVIDVRSPGEFAGGHLPQALNMPVDQVETLVPRRVKDRSQVLLLHCQSGMRSGVAKKKLQALGYRNAFNLGSYGRAARIVADHQ